MAANIQTRNGNVCFAFTGDIKKIWHRTGNEMAEGASRETWEKKSGLDFRIEQVPLLADLRGNPVFAHMSDDELLAQFPQKFANVHSVTGYPVAAVSTRFDTDSCQPSDLLDYLDMYRKADSRFHYTTMGALDKGARIFAQLEFRDNITIAGDRHKAYLLASTAYNGKSATLGQVTFKRVVCENTLDGSLTDKRAIIKVRHNTQFDKDAMHRDLTNMAAAVDSFKKIGDAMALVPMTAKEIGLLFKELLGIEPNAKEDDIPTRALNQFHDLTAAYHVTKNEGQSGTVFAALQAVTRYVDHTKQVRNTEGTAELSRFSSAQFGAGATMKAQAVQFLMPLIKDKVRIDA